MSTAVASRTIKPTTLTKPNMPLVAEVAPVAEVSPLDTASPDAGVRVDRWGFWFWLGGAALLIGWHFCDFIYGLWTR